MHIDSIFIETIEDLRRRSDLRASEYDMVQASGLIRRLLIDQPQLWTEVNRTFKTKPVLHWIGMCFLTEETVESQVAVAGLMLDPVIAEAMIAVNYSPDKRDFMTKFMGFQHVEGNIQRFLSHKVLIRMSGGDPSIPQESASVLDLIKHYANCEGGVHYDPVGRSANDLILEIKEAADQNLRLTIVACSRIILRALEPMAAATMLKAARWPAGLNFGTAQ
ncbi:hypothetical protein [Nocardia sp.]|uniref:hypothetical protein n=1 Tax=Nocardia sp. TaxID=1821 RepID=UPI00261D314F|nr:hypothetical protein [Nocardia sp.]